MARLQRFLAIPMAATALGCLWLLYRLAGQEGLWTGLAWSALLAGLLIAFGVGQRAGRAVGVFVTAAAGMIGILAVGTAPAPNTSSAHNVAGAAPWSETKVAEGLAAGHPIFVYFTADWCLTCKANEAAAIDRGSVRDAFKQAGVVVLAGDWTNGDPTITRFLESRGRAGVPLYLWFEPSGQVEELPQLLTPSMLIDRARHPRRRAA
jgi:thiol:disulfide interchange protein